MRLLLVLGALVLGLAGWAMPAGAHAVLLEARPADGMRLDHPPRQIELRFNEPVVPIFARLFDGEGEAVAGAARLEAADAGVVLRLDDVLPDGAYLLSWRVTSLDAHPVGGTVRFTVGEAVPASPPADVATGDSPLRWVHLGVRAAQYGLVLLAAGLAIFLLVLRPPPPLAAVARRWAVLASGLELIATVLRLGATGLDLALLPPSALLTAEAWQLAFALPLGTALAVAGLGLGLLLSGLLMLETGRLQTLVLGAGAAGALLSFALTGHVLTVEPRWLGPPLVLLHAGCAAFWVGALLPLRAALDLAPTEAGGLMLDFSKLATITVNLLMLAGFALAWLMVGEPRNLIATGYGLRLLGKLALVAGMLAIAALNLVLLTPRLQRGAPGARRWLRRVLAVDLYLVAGVIVMTASLELGPPPGALTHPQHEAEHHADHDMHHRMHHAWTTRLDARGYQVTLRLAPARAGPNRVQIEVRDAQGRPVAPVAVDLAVSLPEAGIEPIQLQARPAGEGGYVVPEIDLLRAGRWAARLDLLIDDFTKVTLRTELPVE